ncbi:MAG: hypothetical protein K2H29_09300 [Oscillospiraceae bacterium]|nr:hypothetical protein [Oscillospiraceae bacterium]
MESKDFYHQAIQFMNDIKNIEPQLVSGSDSEFCLLKTDKQTIYAGVTSVRIRNGQIMRACPEFNAVMTMIASGETTVEELITVSFSSKEVSQPCPECLKLLCDTDPENKDTEIYVAPNQHVKASELLSPGAANFQKNQPENPQNSQKPEISEKSGNPAKQSLATGFAAVSENVPPPAAMSQAPKNPLPSANDFAGFATDGEIGDFGFEAAETPEETEEQNENEFEEKAAANQDNPFYAPPAPQNPAPNIMQPGGYPQQQQPMQQSYYQPQAAQPYSPQAGVPNSYYYNQPYAQPQPYPQPQQTGAPASYYYQPPQQSMYFNQPPQQQSVYFNQLANHSQTVSNYYGQAQPQSSYYSSQMAPTARKTEKSAFKSRLANFIDDDTAAGGSDSGETGTISREETLRLAKERKRQAKLDANSRKNKRGF